MFQIPERNSDPNGDQHSERELNRTERALFTALSIVTNLGLIAFTAAGIALLAGGEEFQQMIEQSQDVPTSFGRMVVELRSMGWTDANIATFMFGSAATALGVNRALASRWFRSRMNR